MALHILVNTGAGNGSLPVSTKPIPEKYIGYQRDKFASNLSWTSDHKWWHRSGSTSAQVMACCVMTPSHYLKHSWLIINKPRSSEIYLRAISQVLLVPQPSITKISLKITNLKFHSNLPVIALTHWLLGAVRHQAITLTNVDPDPYVLIMVSLGHNELKLSAW